MRFNRLTTFLLLSCLVILALGVNGATRNIWSLDPKSILKTIESGDDEVIDCVDIYKQPAFRHPRLANHTLQMKPSSYPIGFEPKTTSSPSGNSSAAVNFQQWHKNGEYCPEGTIPIVRSSPERDFPQKTTHPMAASSSLSTNARAPTDSIPEFATAFLAGSDFHGAKGDINVWNPNVVEKEFTTSQFWITDGGGGDIDSIEAGWLVSGLTHKPALIIYWTTDGYKRTGCFNLVCPGFVQTSNKITLGGYLQPISVYAGQQFQMRVLIYRDDENGNWWVNIEGEDVGYFPPNIFNGGLKGPASLLEFGGEVVNTNPNGFHTATGMGSGRFSGERFSRAAFFENLKYISDAGRELRDAKGLTAHATRPECYDIELEDWNSDMEVHFYFGGVGYSLNCPH